MAGLSKLIGLAILGAGASIAAFASETCRSFLSSWISYDAPGGGWWRILAVVFALTNIKNMPFVWHFRFFGAFFYHVHVQPIVIPPHALFQPVKTSSRTSLMETDYNIHKSNSTYFSDMDISRTHLFTAVVRRAIQKTSGAMPRASNPGMGATEGTQANHMIALGGISCLFKKEIKPFAKYEMWTRILTWDKKWFYLVTHLVKPGVAQPKGWTLQPWKKTKENSEEVNPETLKKAIFATALAKYVVKAGRITVPPEQVLLNAEMVPVKPEGWVYKGEVNGSANGEDILPGQMTEGDWNWDTIETERLKGIQFAENFVGLDGLHDCFDGGNKGALGDYADIYF